MNVWHKGVCEFIGDVMYTEQPRIPGIIIAGTGSNTGKTTATLALLCALAARGIPVRAAKTGPDYIDAAFHAAITGLPVANLDTWMCREAPPRTGESPLTSKNRLPRGLRSVFARMAEHENTNMPAPALLVVEGAMGLYDGGHGGVGSTAQLAALLNLPVLLICSAAGLGQSVAPLVEGFVRHRPQWLSSKTTGPRFLGVICTHVGSVRHAQIIEDALKPLEKTDALPLLGLLPRAGAPALKSRHLGLVEAREALSALDRPALARWFEEHCRLDALLHLAGAANTPQSTTETPCSFMAEPEKDGSDTGEKFWGARFFSPRPPATLHAVRHVVQQPAQQAIQQAQGGTRHDACRQTRQDAVQAPDMTSVSQGTQQGMQQGGPNAITAPQGISGRNRPRRRLRVGMAWDAAFSFCYADLPPLLTELGAELVPFSPLHDAAPPDGCSGLYFPGGYPELHAPQLAANAPMLDALRTLARNGLPIYGECGGYIYLMHSLRLTAHDGADTQMEHRMAGLLPIRCTLGQERAALGYRAGLALPGWPQSLPGITRDFSPGVAPDMLPDMRPDMRPGWSQNRPQHRPQNRAQALSQYGSKTERDAKHRSPAPIWVRGHEFHYAREEDAPLPAHCAPVWNLYDSKGVFLRQEGCRSGSVAGTWLHCYPEGSRRFWRAWLKTASLTP